MRRALTTVLAIHDAKQFIEKSKANVQAEPRRHLRVRVEYRSECGQIIVVPSSAIKRQTLGPIVEAQWREPT